MLRLSDPHDLCKSKECNLLPYGRFVRDTRTDCETSMIYYRRVYLTLPEHHLTYYRRVTSPHPNITQPNIL
jgi:hypothetical protein